MGGRSERYRRQQEQNVPREKLIIDISATDISISDYRSVLRSTHLSQLSFWGMRKHGDNSYIIPKNEKTLIKILNYFDSENLYYNLSPECKNILSGIQLLANKLNSNIAVSKDFKNGKYNTSQYKAFSEFLQNKIPRSLRDHQIKAAFHLYLSENAANFSVPGSGKTSVVISVYEKLRQEGKVNCLYIVGPPACFGPWRVEYQSTLNRKPNYTILAGGDNKLRKLEYYCDVKQRSEMYLTTFQTLSNDIDDVIHFMDCIDNKVFLIIDEAHYIKQLGGTWAEAILKISEHAISRCVLTGTPIPNKYTDIVNIFDFLWPRFSPLTSEDKMNIKLCDEEGDSSRVKVLLDEKIGPLFYRVRKSELGLIPAFFHAPILLEMNKNEKQIYKAIINGIRHYALQDYMRNIELINYLKRGRMMRLRQSISYPKLLNSAIEQYKENLIPEKSDLAELISNYDQYEKPAKLEYLADMVDDFQNEGLKVVIWSHFIGTLELIIRHLSKSGFYCKLIYGATPIEQRSIEEEETREKIQKEFLSEDSDLNILVANPAACGESISLHKGCYHAVYYDLSYNCAQYLQSLDRIHRVGGSEYKQAHYHYLQYNNTLDQDIAINLQNKAERMANIIDQDYGIYSLNMFDDDDDLEAYNAIFSSENKK